MVALRSKLTEKHWQAIKLLEQGLSRKETAVQMGWSYDYFKDLCAGDIAKAGFTAELFSREVKKIDKIRDESTRALVKENIFLVQTEIGRLLKDIKAKKKLSLDDKKLIASLNNSLNKSTPPHEGGNLSLSYTKGLSAEELLLEYKKMKSIVEGNIDSRSKLKEDGGGYVPF